MHVYVLCHCHTCVQHTLIFDMLSGGSYIDIYQMHGVAPSSFYQYVWQVCDAITTEFPLEFPIDDEEELEKLAAPNNRRGRGLLEGCVGAIDGIAIKIEKPKLRDCLNPKRYWNRKHFYAVVMQAICDEKCRCTMS